MSMVVVGAMFSGAGGSRGADNAKGEHLGPDAALSEPAARLLPNPQPIFLPHQDAFDDGS